MVSLWTPGSYNTSNVLIRRNPNASVYEPGPGAITDTQSYLIRPNANMTLGDSTAVAVNALGSLSKAGKRGAAVSVRWQDLFWWWTSLTQRHGWRSVGVLRGTLHCQPD
jgi:hypothetical protein